MVLAPFADTTLLQTYVQGLGRPALTAEQLALGQLLLDAVSQAVRADTGQLLTRGTSTATLYPSCPQGLLLLPQHPVVSVDEVLIGGDPATGWQVRDGWLLLSWPRHPLTGVTVTWTYGYDPAPADVVLHVLMAATAGLDGAQQVANERLGDYAVAFAAAPPGEHLALGRANLIARYGLHTGHMVQVGPSGHR